MIVPNIDKSLVYELKNTLTLKKLIFLNRTQWY